MRIRPESSNVSTAPTRPGTGNWAGRVWALRLHTGSCYSIRARSKSRVNLARDPYSWWSCRSSPLPPVSLQFDFGFLLKGPRFKGQQPVTRTDVGVDDADGSRPANPILAREYFLDWRNGVSRLLL